MKKCSYGYSFEFQPYKGYDKFEYDVLLNDGKILLSCYPNGGRFNSLNEDLIVDEIEVSQIRYTHKPIWGITKPVNPYPFKSEDDE